MLAYILGIPKRSNKGITNRGKEMTNRDRDYKSEQGLKIGTEHSNGDTNGTELC